MKKNKLPAYWYLENEYPEVREYLQEQYGYGNTSFWDGFNYIGCIPKHETKNHNGVFACATRDNMHRKGAIPITIEEFRAATKKEEIINNYLIY